jgi:hypothetical protein
VRPWAPRRDRQQEQHPGVALHLGAGERQRAGQMLPQAGRVVGEPATGHGPLQHSAVLADQTHPTSELAQLPDRVRLVLAVHLADPGGVPAEGAHRLLDDGRR